MWQNQSFLFHVETFFFDEGRKNKCIDLQEAIVIAKMDLFEIAEVTAMLRQEPEMLALARHLFGVLHSAAEPEEKALAFQTLGDLQVNAAEAPRLDAVLIYISRGLRDLSRRSTDD